MASLHDPRALEQHYLNASRLIVHRESRASHQEMRIRRGVRSQLADEQADAVVGGV